MLTNSFFFIERRAKGVEIVREHQRRYLLMWFNFDLIYFLMFGGGFRGFDGFGGGFGGGEE